MDYEAVVNFTSTGGLIYFILLFAGVLVYALWPRNRGKFRDAAQIPFKED